MGSYVHNANLALKNVLTGPQGTSIKLIIGRLGSYFSLFVDFVCSDSLLAKMYLQPQTRDPINGHAQSLKTFASPAHTDLVEAEQDDLHLFVSSLIST